MKTPTKTGGQITAAEILDSLLDSETQQIKIVVPKVQVTKLLAALAKAKYRLNKELGADADPRRLGHEKTLIPNEPSKLQLTLFLQDRKRNRRTTKFDAIVLSEAEEN